MSTHPIIEVNHANFQETTATSPVPVLLDFGAVGRSSVEPLKASTNPAVRRTAIDLLRVFGGDEALPELESMLGDPDQQVQRDAVRAIVQIGSDAAYAVLQRTLGAGGLRPGYVAKTYRPLGKRTRRIRPAGGHGVARRHPLGGGSIAATGAVLLP